MLTLSYSVLGQLFMMGFDGTNVTEHIRDLIENHHLGSILLTAKNLTCMLEQSFTSTASLTKCSCTTDNEIGLRVAEDCV